MKPALTFGGWLKRRRGGLGLTQKELAQQAGYAHVTLRKVEADELRPSREMAERLAELLQIPPERRMDFVRFARDQAHWDEVGSLHELPASPPVETATPPPRFTLFTASAQKDWGDAPDVSGFCGRAAELQQLQGWLVNDRCKVAAVLGMGGIGKTALATAAAAQAQTDFSSIIWRSLRNAPPLGELLGDCLQTLAGPEGYALPEAVDKRLSLLLEHLRGQRCLLVLDNFETVLGAGSAGHYLPGYEGYGELLKQAGEGRHQSCLLLTSREKPQELIPLAGERSPVRTLGVHSLPIDDARLLLHDRGLLGSDADWAALHARYSGNPLALQIVAETIRELFAGDLAQFLSQDVSLFGGINDLLDQQFARLTALEQEVMFWLAVEREPVGTDDLADDFMQRPEPAALLGALQGLRRRFLVESTHGGYTPQNVVLEYVTARLIERAAAELLAGEPALLQHHALMKATAKSYVRESQRDLILKPLLRRVESALGAEGIEELLSTLPAHLRGSGAWKHGYAGGNILNLLVQSGVELRGKDFSRLSVRQADLRHVHAQDMSFASAGFEQCAFTDTFSIVRGLAFRPDDQQLAAGTLGGDVRVWRVRDGQQLLGWTAHPNGTRCICYSPDGSLLATGGYHSISISDAADGRRLRDLAIEADVWSICFSPDGSLLASGSSDRMARLWDWRSGECLHVLAGHQFDVQAVCFGPDGKLLLSGSEDTTLRLWDTETGTCLNTLEGHEDGVISVCFSPDGGLLASCSADSTARIWDTHTGECRWTLPAHTGGFDLTSFSPDGDLLATRSRALTTVQLWNPHTGECLHVLGGQESKIMSMRFSPSGDLLATGGIDGTVGLWDVATGSLLRTLRGDRPYERMNIAGVTGITPAQIASLRALGAVERV